ncbi:hypothetical protein RZS28_18650 (plasmid) [Methylocapsa polymorpha]|uniref:CobQ/CobB/MinD/ParA nucleotide binding domain-containing protein n=1 Tax=Methylocapsa polymorpha TaxID=3080828 RepID=A0ABZ0HWU8_9HYPH|nr:hypothetical protein [Methylocapsa sp. RX1]WOJ91749.1 hypothetical protein RZS28_18650 [Methylocapsa sp. RX1]
MNPIAEQATSFSAAAEAAPTIDLSTPKFVLPLGRGRSGKSLLARWLVERARSQRREVVVADADRITPSLSPYFQDALRLSGRSEPDVLAWFCAIGDRQIDERLSAVVDLGPGADTLDDLRKLGCLSVLADAQIRQIAIHVVGPNPADLSYLAYLDKLLPFATTIIVLNEALSDRSPETAFDQVIAHHLVTNAISRGAKTIRMPTLHRSSDIEVQRLSFAAAKAGLSPVGAARISPFTSEYTALWLQKMETNFAPVAHLLP